MSVADRDVRAVLALHERLDRVRRDDRFTQDRNGAAVRHLTEALLWSAFHVRALEQGEARREEYNRLVRSTMHATRVLGCPVEADGSYPDGFAAAMS